MGRVFSPLITSQKHATTGRASTKSFYTHHVAAISSAIVRADALLVRNAAASLAFQLAHAPGPS